MSEIRFRSAPIEMGISVLALDLIRTDEIPITSRYRMITGLSDDDRVINDK